MELTALRQTIEASLRLKNNIRKVLYSEDLSEEIRATSVKEIDNFHDRSFTIISEFIVNCTIDEKLAMVYLRQLRNALSAMRRDFRIVFEGDEKKEFIFTYYLITINKFIAAVIHDIQPYYSGPTTLDELAEEIAAEKLKSTYEGIMSAEESKEVNAKLIFLKETGVIEAFEEAYKKHTGKIIHRDMAKAFAFLFDKPGSSVYIAGLMPKLSRFKPDDVKNTPYTLKAVNSAMQAIVGSGLKVSKHLEQVHEKLVLRSTSDKSKPKKK